MENNIEKIIKFLNIKNYIFIDNYHKNNQIRVIIQDKLGYKYDVQFGNLSVQKPKIVHKFNPFSLENIGIWIKINKKNFLLLKNNIYLNANEKLRFKCLDNKCKEIFFASWHSIFSGRGCTFCSGFEVGRHNNLEYLFPEIAKEWDKSNFIKAFEITCGSTENILWKCKKCGYKWNASPNQRTYYKTGCPSCSGLIVSDSNRLSILFPEISKEWHPIKNGNLTPNDISYGSNKKFWWLCPKGHEYYSAVNNRINGRNCKKCKIKKGEKEIIKILDIYNVKYKFQCNDFKDCRDKIVLYFDFYLPDYNICIEYQGIQHYEPIDFAGRGKKWAKEEFKKNKRRDKIKIKYCQKNNIKLIIIPYWNFDEIENILKRNLKI